MLGQPAIGAQPPHARSADPYRVLFDQLAAGAARCRPIVERDEVVDVEILDSNRAFGALRSVLPRLFGLLARVHRLARPETVRLWGDGRTLAASAYPVGDDEVDEVMVVVEDVTVREQLEQRSHDSQLRFEQAFHGNAAAMVIAHRSDLRIIDVNPRWLEMFGATRSEVIGKSPVELGVITAARAQTRIAEHRQFTEGHDVELELSTRAGASITVLASAKPIEIAEGTCTLTTLIDITALRELQRELERRVQDRTQALEASNRDLEAFSFSVSHDLRAPLRAIVGFSEIVLDEFAATLPHEARTLLARIHASGGRLRTLVDDLLAFARLGRGDLVRERIDLDALVRCVLDEALAGRGLADHPDRRLELRLDGLGTCHADPTLLRTVWTNLIDNALKYSQGRNPIILDIGRERRGDETVYHVRDNGVGFDMAHASRLFGVFQRLHSASDFEGSGIGLANVRRIVERHHGRVAAHSELGHGTTFEFTLGMEVP